MSRVITINKEASEQMCSHLDDKGYIFILQDDGSEVILDEDHNEVGTLVYKDKE